jgi:hypothetical protein
MGSTAPTAIRDVADRTREALAAASAEAVGAWISVRQAADSDLPGMGLAAGERPAADVEVLAIVLCAAEYDLARRMHAAASSGCLPLPGPGMMLAARTWSLRTARRLARCGALAADHPSIAQAWADGVINSEHVDAVASSAEHFTAPELTAIVAELEAHWGGWSPAAIARFVREADRMLHPPGEDPEPDERGAHESRNLSFALTSDTVILSGELPRFEGEMVIAAIDAFAERLRSAADHVPAGARRADALVELVSVAHASGSLPTRGGLPVSVTVTLDHTSLGHPLWRTSRGHRLTDSEARFAGCDAAVTPVVVERGRAGGPAHFPDTAAGLGADAAAAGVDPGEAAVRQRLAALAVTLLSPQIPLAVGRTERTATAPQRRALAVRDRGCIIPGCGIVAEACQVHHVIPWAEGGQTDLPGMALLCWSHHRQVDLRMWSIEPASAEGPPPTPPPGSPKGVAWPGNNGSPWVVRALPRSIWRT